MGLDNEVDVGDALNMTDNNNKEREVQDVRDKDFMYEPLLDNEDMDILMEENDHEIEIKTGSQDELQGVEQEDPALKKTGQSWQPSRHQGEALVARCSRHGKIVISTSGWRLASQANT